MDILLLTTPVQHSDINPGVIQNTRELQSWCETLPTMNVIETVELFKKAITPFNEQQIASEDRLKLLEIYRKTFEEVLCSYDELRLRTLPVPPEQRKAIAEDIMWLYLDLANGYKIIIKEAHDTNKNPKKSTAILTSIYRAMELLLTSIVYAKKAHTQSPPLVLLEIKQLYLFAEFHELGDARLKSIKDRLSPASVGNLFKQFVLFSTLKDDLFAAEDILEFNIILDNFTPQVFFINYDNIQDSTFAYSIDLINDEPPERIQQNSTIQDSDTLRFIDISRAQAIMLSITEQKKSPDSFMANKEDQLLRTYLSSFNKPAPSAQPQTAIKRIKLANGIDTIHYFLEHNEEINELFSSEINSGIEVQSFNFDEEISANLTDWTLIEEADMARVLISEDATLQGKIELNAFVALIQLISQNQPAVFITGIVRKIREEEDGITKLGIEVLPGQPLPFSYLYRNGQDHVKSGLYFPPINALKRPASLLIDKNDFKNDMNCSITLNSQELEVQATNTIMETRYFTQFNFDTLD